MYSLPAPTHPPSPGLFVAKQPTAEATASLEAERMELMGAIESVAIESRSCPAGGPPEEAPAELEGEELNGRIKQLHRHVCAVQCRRYLGAHRDVEGGTDLDGVKSEVASLVEEYRFTLDLNKGAVGGQKEVQHGDELVLLAAEMLRDVWTDLAKVGGGWCREHSKSLYCNDFP